MSQVLLTLPIAEAAARAGAEIVARYFRDGCTIRSKASYNLVCDADVEAEHAVVAVIREAFPDHAILGEEAHTPPADAEHLWIIDPLDGTNNFAHRVPHFAVSVAYWCGGVAQCGAVLHPILGDLYTAARGQGAFRNGARLSVGTETQLDQALIGVGFYYDRGQIMEATLLAIRDLFRQNIHGIRRFGAAALDLCAVASGLFGAFFEYELSPWDFAAGKLIVEEAGGRVTTCDGSPLSALKSSLLASNARLHEAVLEIVRRNRAGRIA